MRFISAKRSLSGLLATGAFATLSACGADIGDADPTVKSIPAEVDVCLAERASPIRIPGGAFLMGHDNTYQEEGPARQIEVNTFWLDATEVTVDEFAAFIEDTGYETVAERPVDGSMYPGADPDLLVPGSAVFKPRPDGRALDYLNWWAYVPGANWQRPLGPGAPAALPHQPAVQIALEDAEAFAAWKGGRLPTEAEWEYAALGGALQGTTDASAPTNANTWQGLFPVLNSADDGFERVAPVGCFEANPYGLHDMVGNVWEWTADAYTPRHGTLLPESLTALNGVIKGGSFLCAQNYCARYRPSARQPQEKDLGTNHIGFRLAYDRPPDPEAD